ncbi:MAG: hypothetical protein Q7S59_03240, partial [Sulfurimonas sp.]|nr:hypothetical protein [Sulfurimonas sp.]
ILSSIQTHEYIFHAKDKIYIDCLMSHRIIKEENNTYKLLRDGKQFIQNGKISKNIKQLINDIVKKD